MLTKFQMFIFIVLFPVKWVIRRNLPYDPMRDIWHIHNKKYSGGALFALANADGISFTVKQVNGVTILERINN